MILASGKYWIQLDHHNEKLVQLYQLLQQLDQHIVGKYSLAADAGFYSISTDVNENIIENHHQDYIGKWSVDWRSTIDIVPGLQKLLNELQLQNYIFTLTMANQGIERHVYHGQNWNICLVGPDNGNDTWMSFFDLQEDPTRPDLKASTDFMLFKEFDISKNTIEKLEAPAGQMFAFNTKQWHAWCTKNPNNYARCYALTWKHSSTRQELEKTLSSLGAH